MNLLGRVKSGDKRTMSQEVALNDSAHLRGRVRILVEEEGDEKIVFDASNVIVNGARKVMTHLLAAAPIANVVSTIKLGTMGHLGEDILTADPPLVTDEALTDPSPLTVSLSAVEYSPTDEDSTVLFRFPLAKADGNGDGTMVYTEAGLFVQSGEMFARETFPALVKNSARRITFEWLITF